MSAKFVAASSHVFQSQTPLITAVPYTVGLWVWPDNTNNQEIVSFNNSANDTDVLLELFKNAGNLTFLLDGTGGTGAATLTLAITNAAWSFVLVRIAANDVFRMQILSPTGAITAAVDTGAVTPAPAGINRMTVGAWGGSSGGGFLDGKIAEFWYTNTDIFPVNDVTPDAWVRQLAYGGPFSMPNIANQILEYISFYAGRLSDNYCPRGNLWVGNQPLAGQHPPIPYWYKRPQDYHQPLLV